MYRIALIVLLGFLALLALFRLVVFQTPDALRLDRDVSRSHILENVRVLDMRTGRLGAVQSLWIEDGRIVEAGDPDRSNLHRIDGAGQIVMPGLIDMHVHVLDEADLAANLAHGVTTIRNLGGMPFHLPLAARIDDRRLLGPQLLSTGGIINERGGRNVHELQTLVSGAEEARRVVRQQYAAGYRDLKVYSNLSRESLAAVLDEAAILGMSVSGHPVEGTEADPVDIGETITAGFATIEHVESIVWAGLDDDTDPARAAALARRFAEARATVSPTLIVHQNLAAITERGEAHLNRPGMESFNPVMFGFEAESYQFWAGFESDNRTVMQAFYVDFTRLLHEAGVELVVGTDAGVMVTPHGRSVLEEIELLISAGLTPTEALQAATINPARALGLAGEIGELSSTSRADLILLRDDPRNMPSTLHAPIGVMRDGVWIDQQGLANLRQASTKSSMPRTWWRVIRQVVTRQN
jgi:imidazolonepropionase-like amidohydrolase